MLVRLAPHSEIALLDDGDLAILTGRGRVYRGNRVAAAMWSALTTHAGDTHAAATAVARRYDAPEAGVQADLDRLVATLDIVGAVTVTP